MHDILYKNNNLGVLMISKFIITFILLSLFNLCNAGTQSDSAYDAFLPLTSDVSGKELVDEKALFPRNFRTMQDPIQAKEGEPLPRLKGLKKLTIAGTAQFTQPQLSAIISHLKTRILVIDLREETHLILEELNGNQIPITAYAPKNVGNVGKTVKEIKKDLLKYQNYILQQSSVQLYYTVNSLVQLDPNCPFYEVGNVYQESEIVKKLDGEKSSLKYYLLPVTDHQIPSPKIIDTYLSLLKKIKKKKNVTVLCHCQAGRGRTGLFLVMTDIVANARKYKLSLDDIIKRQALLGSPDFTKVKPGKTEQSGERYEFLKNFYEFVVSKEKFNFGDSYSDWIKIQSQ